MKSKTKAKTGLDYDHPFWPLIGDDGNLPEKNYFFKTEHNVAYALEDFFQHNSVFTDSSGGKRHSDSYGTLVDFTNLDKCLALLDEHYKPEPNDWLPAIEYWLTNPNMQPPLRLVALTIARRYRVDVEEFHKQFKTNSETWKQ